MTHISNCFNDVIAYLQADELIFNNFNCALPWMIKENNYELCPIIDKNRNNSYADIVTTWYDSYLLNDNNCPKMPKCKRSVYQMDLSTTENGIYETANLLIKLKNPNILTIVDEYSYDLQSFIGEVGGTLGLFLGLSMFSCIEFIEYVLRKLCSKNVY